MHKHKIETKGKGRSHDDKDITFLRLCLTRPEFWVIGLVIVLVVFEGIYAYTWNGV